MPSFLPPSLHPSHPSLLLVEFPFSLETGLLFAYPNGIGQLLLYFFFFFFGLNTFNLLKLHEIKCSPSRRHCRLTEALDGAGLGTRCISCSVQSKEKPCLLGLIEDRVACPGCHPGIQLHGHAIFLQTRQSIEAEWDISAYSLPSSAILKKERVNWPK